jgi:hypothetical protein
MTFRAKAFGCQSQKIDRNRYNDNRLIAFDTYPIVARQTEQRFRFWLPTVDRT